jgi:predicted AAA+ superfamily ATPase
VTYIFRKVHSEPWAQALVQLTTACLSRDSAEVAATYADLYAALAEAGHADLFGAAAAALLYAESPLSSAASAPPEGLLSGAGHDLTLLLALLRRDWHAEAAEIVGNALPSLECLGASREGPVKVLSHKLRDAEVEDVLADLLTSYRTNGSGDLARFPAFRWSGGQLQGVSHPAWTEAERLVGVEGALARLRANTEAFLAGHGGQHTLLYGPRGSGKSTALRSLGGRYAAAGLRLIEVVPERLGELPEILEALRGRPHRYLLFVDDLSFEAGSGAYGPLKSLLEGSLGGRPENALVYATSNRRHLVGERFSERPDPLNDDVHAWDTQHERLALSDRFGLVITFPDATQRRYLEIVRALAERDGLTDADLDAKAVRFADWGNGYSGRTAQQFLEALRSGLV